MTTRNCWGKEASLKGFQGHVVKVMGQLLGPS
jgi:hypothetical protein